MRPVPRRALRPTTDGVGLHHGHGQAVGDHEDDREDPADRRQTQTAGDVVGRAPAVGAVAAIDLEQLTQGRLGEGGGGAHQGHHPHPEDGARPAQDQGEGDADDIARAHAAGQPHGEGLEGGDTVASPVP